MKKVIAVLVVGILMAGCSGDVASLGAIGNEHKIEMYSGGVKVREWTSTGKVQSEVDSDGYYFRDKETRMYTTVSGDVVITALP